MGLLNDEYQQDVAVNSGLLRGFNSQNISAGLIASILVMTGPALIVLQAAEAGGFTNEQTINWMFAIYFFGGLFSIIMPLYFRIPITGGHSITGAAFLVAVTSQFTYAQLIGGYVMSGLVILLVGVSGLFTKIIQWVPKEVISAMLGGLVTGYVVQIVPSVKEMPIVGIAAVVSFYLGTRYVKKLPPVVITIAVAFLVLFLTEGLVIGAEQIPFTLPSLQMPEFTLMGLLTIALPLAMLILSNDAAPGIGALESADYKPHIRKIVSSSGGFSMIAGFFGGQCANIAGMMTAICSGADAGKRDKRYLGAVVSGIVTLLFGIFAWKIVPFIQSLPSAFVAMVAGFSLITVLYSSLQKGFAGERYRLSALTAFIVTLSDIQFFHISAPVWALILGALVAHTIEKEN
ncbi:benzoate/H(+) symporter BenE family transporter [Mesobacillus maritimus]|uniref:benzoate/H(+) symporter BenE family transporter n=1 Tax=Mesobacillus maritimus TaxID=1643336 RepID=UPI00203E3204|nr:benzoate/H(+) symporter BenE family transporter [Mesobacillus maritimus]MCM3585486.1 benzoate/H(+) symporter BenE family transporter [Mesobacillus maritimus]